MQNKVKEFNEKIMVAHEETMPVSARLLDIESEIGELAKEYLKATNYGTTNFGLSLDFEEEFGDVLYALLSLANETGIDCEKSLNVVLNKLESRLKKKNDIGSGR